MQKKSTTLAYEDKLVDDTVIVNEKNELDETTPSSFRQTVFNPE